MNEKLVPLSTILRQEQDGLSRRAHTSVGARGLNFHQRHKAVNFGFAWSKFSQDASEAERVVAKRRPQPVVTGGRGIAFIENQIDHFKHRRESSGRSAPRGTSKGTRLAREGPFGADDALGNRSLGNEEGAGDLLGGQPTQQAKCKRNRELRLREPDGRI